MQAAAEIGEAVGRFDLDAQLAEPAQDPDDLAKEVFRHPLQSLHRGGGSRIDLVGLGNRVTQRGQLAFDGEKLRAQLADLLELLLQPGHQRVRLPQREDPYVLERIHQCNVHDHGQRATATGGARRRGASTTPHRF